MDGFFFFNSSIPNLQCHVSFRWTAQWFNHSYMGARAKSLQSCPTLSMTPWAITYQAPLSMGFFSWRIPEWVAVPSTMRFSPPGNWTRVSLCPLHWQAASLPLGPPGKPLTHTSMYIYSFQTLLCYKILQNTECGSLCYTVGPYWLFIWYIEVCIC